MFMKVQEEILASDLLQMKENLNKEVLKIETMREELNKPGWRKMAGELIANDTLDKIE